MKLKKIGIPRISIYNKDGVLIKNFFLYLGYKIVLSNIEKEKYNNDLVANTCSYIKNYYEHIISLKNSCDYIIISNNCDYYQKCQKYKQLISNINCHLDKSQLLIINQNKIQLLEYLKIGFKLTKNPLKIIISYLLAKEKQRKHNINKINHEKNKLNSTKIKVLMVANYNNIENNIIAKHIINKLKKQDIKVLLSNYTKEKAAIIHSSYYEYKVREKETKKLVGAIYYYRYSIRGIIYLNNKNCLLDKYIINTIRNAIKEIPIINISIEEEIDNIETTLNILIKEINKYN